MVLFLGGVELGIKNINIYTNVFVVITIVWKGTGPTWAYPRGTAHQPANHRDVPMPATYISYTI